MPIFRIYLRHSPHGRGVVIKSKITFINYASRYFLTFYFVHFFVKLDNQRVKNFEFRDLGHGPGALELSKRCRREVSMPMSSKFASKSPRCFSSLQEHHSKLRYKACLQSYRQTRPIDRGPRSRITEDVYL